VKFGFVAKHRGVWPAAWLCGYLGVSRSGFQVWLTRPRSARSRSDEALSVQVGASFVASDRTYGARRVWHDLLAAGVDSGLHRVERLMRQQALRARPRRPGLPPDIGERKGEAAANVLDRRFTAPAPNQKWVADFTYVSKVKTRLEISLARCWFIRGPR
jgi:putative transposase